MKRFFLIALTVILAVPFPATAQSLPDVLKKTVGQNLVEDAVGRGFVVVRRDYQLVDSTGARFGWEGNEEFSSSFSVGIRTEEGLLVGEEYAMPWEGDSNYANFRDLPYRPDATTARWHEAGTVDHNYVQNPAPDSLAEGLYLVRELREGFPVDHTPGTKQGLLVLFLAGAEVDDGPVKEFSFHMSARTFTVDSVPTAQWIDPLPKTGKRVIGGVFVCQEIGYGSVRLRLAGVLQQRSGRWVLVTPFVDSFSSGAK